MTHNDSSVHWSTRLEPSNPLMVQRAIFSRFGAYGAGPYGALDGPPDPQNCSYASPRMCRDLFHPYSTLFHQIGATRPTYGQKRTFLASLDPLCALWCPWMAPYDPQNCCKAPPQMFPDLFHPYSKLFHQIVATRPAYGQKRSFLALFCNLLGALWRPRMAHPNQRNCSDASPRLWPNLFNNFPTFACKGNPCQIGSRIEC